jgi:hypothetical protein
MKHLILATLYLLPALVMADSSCAYPSKKDDGSIDYFEDCGSINGDKVILNNSHLNNLAFDSDGLACVMFSTEDIFYIHQNGHKQRTYFFDNGCDYFEEDLARGINNGKMVYINKQLEIALTPDFEFLSRFDYGHAVVCNGPFNEHKQGEHALRTGGRCGLINHQGELVVEAKYNIEDQQPFQDYINSNNHCPKPPVVTESAALCHAQRHVSNMDYHSEKWIRHQITKVGDIWVISFVEEDSDQQEFTLTLNASNAQWYSLVKEPHNSVVQEIQSEHQDTH